MIITYLYDGRKSLPLDLDIELYQHADSLAEGKQDPEFAKKPELAIKLIDLTLICLSLASWLSSHPGGNERVSDLENLISRNSYNRYAYQGVGHHGEIQARVKKLLQEKKATEEKK